MRSKRRADLGSRQKRSGPETERLERRCVYALLPDDGDADAENEREFLRENGDRTLISGA